jgi:hypothetical protein
MGAIYNDGLPALFWNSTHYVKFKIKVGFYTNFLEFLIEHKISFLADILIDFTKIPLSLHGYGLSTNLKEYLANNAENTALIINFLNYFITTIADFKYSSGKKLNYDLSYDYFLTWQDTPFYANDNYITTTTTTIITTTLSPTTTLPSLGFFEIFGQLYQLS